MTASGDVDLEPATAAAATLLSNLLELYVHDMSEIYPVEIGADGRFGYDALLRYWSEPATRVAFLIRFGGRVAGFALVTRGSPATADPADLDVAEFFVLRSYRGAGVGRRAAFLLWNRLPGHWIVRVSEANRGGLPFWERVVDEYTGGAFMTHRMAGSVHRVRVFSFTSRAGAGRDAAMSVRAALPVEIDHLARVWYDGWQDAHARILPAELARIRTLESFRERLEAGLPGVRVVGPWASPVGFCILKGDELNQLYVSAPARGSGAAAALMTDAEARLADDGVETAWLACAIGNDRAARFYEKCGWRRAGTVIYVPEDANETPLEVWRYEKRLRP